MLQRPAPDEYAPYNAQYVDLVPGGDVLDLLEKQREEMLVLLDSLSEEEAEHRYAPGKWSLKEVVGHLIDTEWIFAYRALCFARGEQQALPGYDQDAYVEGADFDERSVDDLATEYRAVREATLLLFRSLSAEAWSRRGIANEQTLSVRAAAYVVAGHERHHLQIIRERYLS